MATSDVGADRRPTTRAVTLGVLGVGAWMVCAAAFAIAYHAHERTVYVWDFYNFPRKFDALVQLTHQGIAPMLRHVRLSLNSDYSDVPAVLLLPAGLIGGPGRAAYLAGVAAEYGAVAMIGMFMLFRSIVARSAERGHVLAMSAALVVAALLPHLWIPILRGYPDVLGMGVLAILLALQVRRPMWERPLTHALGVGLAMAGLLLFRRWYAYFVIAWSVAVVGDLAYLALRRRLDGAPWRAVRGLVASGLVAGTAAALLLYVALSPARIHAMATTSYRTLYAGYRSHGLGAVLALDWAWLGAATAVLIFAGLVFARRYWPARAVVVLAIYTIVGVGLFQYTQDFGMHHWYGVMPVLAVCVMTGVYGLITSCARASARASMTVAVGLLAVLQLGAMVSPTVHGALGAVAALFPSDTGYPLVRHDTSELRRLLQTLDAERRPGERIYVVASSFVLNDDVLRWALPQWGASSRLGTLVLPTAQIDSRDGFPERFFNAQLVVTAAPTQFHMPPDVQQTVTLLADGLAHDTTMQRHFERLPFTFQLDSGTTVSLLRQTTPFTAEEHDALLARYHRLTETTDGVRPDE